MKDSPVTMPLRFGAQGPKSVTEAEKLSDGYLINLIDSPGHVDFCR